MNNGSSEYESTVSDEERWLVTAIVQDPTLLPSVCECLETKDFVSPVARDIYAVACDLADRSERIDVVSVKTELRDRRQYDAAVEEWLKPNTSFFADEARLSEWANKITDDALHRRQVSALTAALAEARAAPGPVDISRLVSDPQLVLPTEAELRNPLRRPFTLRTPHELTELAYKPAAFVVDHVVPASRLTLLTGDTGSGKSALMIHTLVARASGMPAAVRFETFADDRPALYVSSASEMSPDDVQRYLREACAGLYVDPPKTGLYFLGDKGVCDWDLSSDDGRQRFRAVLRNHRPAIIALDTLRGLFPKVDENNAAEVRAMNTWLRGVCDEFECAIVTSHHQRKLSMSGNAPRERASGSRDLIAGVDNHIALLAQSGRPVNGLLFDKTRTPKGVVRQGTEIPIEARLEENGDGPMRSIFIAGEPTISRQESTEDAEADLRAALRDNPKTLEELNARSGNRKRAYEKLRTENIIVGRGKKGRKTLYALTDVEY